MKSRDLVLEHFAALSPKLQAAARFVVDHPNEVVIASMRSVAERAGAQPATLVRLAQRLGFAGWPELKAAFAEDLGLHSAGYGERARNLVARGPSADLLTEMFAVQHQNLQATEALSAASLRKVAKRLKSARVVHVAGFRASFAVAHTLVYGYRLFRDTVHLIDALGGGIEMQLRPIERQDVVVVIGFSPYSRETFEVVEAAAAVGAGIVALTDSKASPLALAADENLLFSAASPSFFPSITCAMAVVESLLELLVADAGKDIAQRIGRAEQGLRDSGAYLKPPPRGRTRQPS